ncbi:MAG: LysR family transcriptional regulator [Marinosulfonomonas sp.]|nr:LysR family transcriptional regulator [Marinosulfonomonas sp.]
MKLLNFASCLCNNARMQNWDSLKYILSVAREGGLSGAARALGVNHATVSRQISRAEQESGQRFFDRLPGGLTLTDAGKRVVAHAELMEAEFLNLNLGLAAESEENATLEITAPPMIANEAFARDVADFQKENPRVEISLFGDNRLFNLYRREADVAIRVSREPPESLWGRIISRQHSGWYASSDYLEKHAAVLAGKSADALPYVMFSGWAGIAPKPLETLFPSATPALICDDMFAAISVARAGMAMVRMPVFVGQGDAKLVRVAQIPLVEYAPIWVLTHPELRKAPAVRAFMSFIADRFQNRRSDFLGPE